MNKIVKFFQISRSNAAPDVERTLNVGHDCNNVDYRHRFPIPDESLGEKMATWLSRRMLEIANGVTHEKGLVLPVPLAEYRPKEGYVEAAILHYSEPDNERVVDAVDSAMREACKENGVVFRSARKTFLRRDRTPSKGMGGSSPY